MASINDVFNELTQANTRLQQLHNDMVALDASVDAVKGSVDAVKGSVDQVVNRADTLIALQTYANQALFHNAQQNDTIICILEHVSQNLCHLLNEAHMQTQLQTTIAKNSSDLTDMFKTAHPEAALELARQAELKKQIEKCCPPEPPRPVCKYEPCEAPKRLDPPPRRPGREPVG